MCMYCILLLHLDQCVSKLIIHYGAILLALVAGLKIESYKKERHGDGGDNVSCPC